MKLLSITGLILSASIANAQTLEMAFLNQHAHSHAGADVEGNGNDDEDEDSRDNPATGVSTSAGLLLANTREISATINGGDDWCKGRAKSSSKIDTSLKFVRCKFDLFAIAATKSTPSEATATILTSSSASSVCRYTGGAATEVGEFTIYFDLTKPTVHAGDQIDLTLTGYVGPYNTVTAAYNQGTDKWDMSGTTIASGGVGPANTVSGTLPASGIYNCTVLMNRDQYTTAMSTKVNDGDDPPTRGQIMVHDGTVRSQSSSGQVKVMHVGFE